MSRYLYSQPDNAVLYDLGLTQTQYRLYNIMVDRMNKKTRQLTMKVRELAKALGRSMITTSRHLSAMAEKGVIIRIFNKSKSNPRVNEASTFVICGRLAKRYEGSEYAGDYPCTEDQKRWYPTVENDGVKDSRESLRENKNLTLTREATLPEELRNTDQTTTTQETLTVPETSLVPEIPETPKEKAPNQEETLGLEHVPDIMRDVVKYLWDETGRDSITPNECRIIREILDKQHTPARVMKAIREAVARFKRKGKNLRMLTFNYLGKVLEGQVSRKPRTTSRASDIPASKSAPASETAQENAPEVASEILPVAEAERVISEHTPAVRKNEGVPAAQEELYARIRARAEEIAKQYLSQFPQDEYGAYIFPDDMPDDDPPDLTVSDYLRLKYPEAEDEELRTDTVQDKRGLQEAFEIDYHCANCENPDSCPYNRKHSKPIVKLQADGRGKKHVVIGYSPRFSCKHDKAKPDHEYERRVKVSGLTEKQSKQTFTAYDHAGMPAEVVSAKAKAILAAKHHTSLILAGKPGTGKTHLATAIALEVMREGKQALFRTVPDLLDELWRADWNHTDFFSLRQKYRDVPCLVLDDWGKEKATEKKLEYLYQIIDYRYRHGLQTVLTTNAPDMAGLMNDMNADKIEPLISRILENGEWVTIREAANHRLKKCAAPATKPEPEEECEILPAPLPDSEPLLKASPESDAWAASALPMVSETATPDTSEKPANPEGSQGAESLAEILGNVSSPEREKCLSVEEIVRYRMEYGEMPPDYEELEMKDRVYVQKRMLEILNAGLSQPNPEEPTKPTARAPLLGLDDEELWKEDEDEYKLPGDSRYRKKDRDKDHEPGA